MELPKVAIIISNYNYGKYVVEAIKSALNQDYEGDIRIVVVDDGSSDDSLQVVKRFQRENTSMVKCLTAFHCEVHDQNRGLAEARNTAFRLSNSDNILILDADNFLLDQACEQLLHALEYAPKSVGAVYPILAVEGHKTQKLANELPWNPTKFRTGNYIDALALVRRKAWEIVGGFRCTHGGWEDFDFWCRFVENGLSAQQIPKLLAVYCHHEDSMKNAATEDCQTRLRLLLNQRHPWLKLIDP